MRVTGYLIIIFLCFLTYSYSASDNGEESMLANLEDMVERLSSKVSTLEKRLEICERKGKERRQAPASFVSFSTRLTRELTGLGIHQPIIFDKVIENSGNGYNAQNGIFSAPVSGTYVFTWTISTQQGRWQTSELVKEGAVFGYALADSINASGDKDYSTASNTVILKVNAGDQIFVRTGTKGDGILDGHNYDSFSGWIIFETD